jgi:hypothetical protein
MTEPLKPITNEHTPITGVFLRIYWIAFAHGAALILTIKMALFSLQRSVMLNLILALIVISVIIVRYIDIRYCNGETANCQKATIHDWRSWSLKVAGFYVTGFILLHLSVYAHI